MIKELLDKAIIDTDKIVKLKPPAPGFGGGNSLCHWNGYLYMLEGEQEMNFVSTSYHPDHRDMDERMKPYWDEYNSLKELFLNRNK